jgi:hypothetical protein
VSQAFVIFQTIIVPAEAAALAVASSPAFQIISA